MKNIDFKKLYSEHNANTELKKLQILQRKFGIKIKRSRSKKTHITLKILREMTEGLIEIGNMTPKEAAESRRWFKNFTKKYGKKT